MNTDETLLLYHCLQYSYNKHVRTNYRINVNQLSILISIHYATNLNPKRWKGSVKQCIKTLNPQMNSYYILRDIEILNQRGLISYEEETPKRYKIEMTNEGRDIIERLFDRESVYSYIEGNKARK